MKPEFLAQIDGMIEDGRIELQDVVNDSWKAIEDDALQLKAEIKAEIKAKIKAKIKAEIEAEVRTEIIERQEDAARFKRLLDDTKSRSCSHARYLSI